MWRWGSLLLIGLLVGCAPTLWVKSGATEQDFNRDSYACERDARQSGYFGSGLVGEMNMRAFYERCMVAQGWRKQQQQERSTESTTEIRPQNQDGPSTPDPWDNMSVWEQMQIHKYCLQQTPAMDFQQCRREEMRKRGL
jgi:hypothetical protein